MAERSRDSAQNLFAPVVAGRILAMDYGRRRIGLAISDELGMTAQPLATIARKNRREDLRKLREIRRKNGVRLLLIGLPLHLDGRRGPMAEEALRFGQRLKKELGLPVEFRDERLTSWAAEELARESRGSRSKKKDLDRTAAAILLREYLNDRQAASQAIGGEV